MESRNSFGEQKTFLAVAFYYSFTKFRPNNHQDRPTLRQKHLGLMYVEFCLIILYSGFCLCSNIDDVDKTMDEINEQTENMKQIQEALSAPIGAAADFDEVFPSSG